MRRPAPLHPRHVDARADPTATNSLGIAALGDVVELALDREGELFDESGRVEELGQVPRSRHHRRNVSEYHKVDADLLGRPGAADLDDDRSTVRQLCCVNLPDRGSSERFGSEGGEGVLQRLAKLCNEDVVDHGIGQCRDRILQGRQCGRERRRHEVRSCRQQLTEFDEGRSEFSERSGQFACGGLSSGGRCALPTTKYSISVPDGYPCNRHNSSCGHPKFEPAHGGVATRRRMGRAGPHRSETRDRLRRAIARSQFVLPRRAFVQTPWQIRLLLGPSALRCSAPS